MSIADWRTTVLILLNHAVYFSAAQEAWLFMQKGSRLTKIRDGQLHLGKTFFLSEDKTFLKWTPSKRQGEGEVISPYQRLHRLKNVLFLCQETSF